MFTGKAKENTDHSAPNVQSTTKRLARLGQAWHIARSATKHGKAKHTREQDEGHRASRGLQPEHVSGSMGRGQEMAAFGG